MIEKPRLIEFFWLLHYKCNYRCPYCVYDEVWPSTLKLDREHTPEQWLAAWERMHARHGPGRITITGGEPTIYPKFASLMGRLNAWYEIAFDTNLSMPLERLVKLCDALDPKRANFLTSFHPYMTEPDVFIEKAKILRDRGFSYVCRLVAYPPSLSKLDEFRRRFLDAGLNFVANPFQGRFEDREYPQSYTDEERALIMGVPAEGQGMKAHAAIADHNLNIHREPPTGRLCRSGFLHAYIAQDGTLWRCYQYQNRKWEPLGSFFDECLRLADEPRICNSPVCEWEYMWLVDQAERFDNVSP